MEGQTADTAKIDRFLEKTQKELARVQAGSDDGQLPLRDLTATVRDLTATDPAFAAFHACAAYATAQVEAVLDTLAPWTEAALVQLRETFAELEALRRDPARPFTAPALSPVAPPAAALTASFELPLPSATETEIPSFVLNLESDLEMLQEFILESNEHLAHVENGILELEANPTNKETLNAIFRAFHTFKGSSGFLNLGPVNRAAHELESLLDLARQGKLEVTTALINLILEGGDLLKQFVIEIQGQVEGKKKPAPIAVPTAALIARVQRMAAGEGNSAPAETEKSTASNTEAKTSGENGARPSESGKMGSLKVDTAKLDALFDLVGEIVIAQSLVIQDADVKKLNSPRLNRHLGQLDRITDELQKIAMSMRMIPLAVPFQKMGRVVRDLSARLGKQVELVLQGEETELDRTIVEEISDPLLHMVRNSIDHGLEMPAVRQERGKPATGRITLRAFHEGGAIVIQIEDDGAGLNTERILKKAREKGIVSPQEELSEAEIFQLIFAPGFSTSETVNDISGRGVGMDVVRQNIERLRGKIEITSQLGKGSRFTISLPLTLAIIEGLILRVGDHRYVLPTLSVRESLRVTEPMLSTLHERYEMVNIRGSLFPLVRLHQAFDIRNAVTKPTEGIVVLIEAGTDRACLLVDALLGKQEVVIKNLGEPFRQVKALAGAAILGDGNVGLILDAAALITPDRVSIN